MTKLKAEDILDTSMRILKTATCSTLSGEPNITYIIGCTPDSKIYFRVSSNTGGGFFSREWVSFEAIQQALKECPEGAPLTSIFLYPLFKGKSVNTPSFLLAALRHSKLVQPLKDKKRNHELLDPKPFLEHINKLITSKVTLTKKKITKKKAATKTTPSVQRKKKVTTSRHKKVSSK